MMLRWPLNLKSSAFRAPLSQPSSPCLASGGPFNETKNGAQVARVGLQEGVFVNERPDRDLPDDLLRHTLGRATTSYACMRKSRSPLSGWPYPLPTIASMMLRWLLNSKSSLFSPLARLA